KLPDDPGPARSRAGQDQRAQRGARLRPVARRLRGAAGGRSYGRHRSSRSHGVGGTGIVRSTGGRLGVVRPAMTPPVRVWRVRKNSTWLDARLEDGGDAKGVELQ